VQIDELEQSAIIGKRVQSKKRVVESEEESEFGPEEDQSSASSIEDPETSQEISAPKKGKKPATSVVKGPSKKEIKAQEKAAELEQRDKMDKEPLFA
jgi:hypothetical protein